MRIKASGNDGEEEAKSKKSDFSVSVEMLIKKVV